MRVTRLLAIRMLLSSILLMLCIACSRQPNDQKIVKDIHNKVAADPDTKDSQVYVTSTKRKVRLNGTVKTAAAQQKVEKFAREEPGIADVDDEITVQPEAAATQPPPAPRHSGHAASTVPPPPGGGA